jgi:hypothetical protein
MEMDWPSTFRADLSIPTHLFVDWCGKKSFLFVRLLHQKAWEGTRHATIPMMHISDETRAKRRLLVDNIGGSLS